MNNIVINTDFIKLDSFLKLACLCDSGGQAKMFILNGEVKVNSNVCLMRGKKLYDGDIVTFKNTSVIVKKA